MTTRATARQASSSPWIRPTAFETATGTVVGRGTASSEPPRHTAATPREALEAAIRPALEQTPCLVTFSGGRDSSAVLAVAVSLARRLGLEPPIPVTRRWPTYPSVDESRWQELVIGHLRVDHWERVDFEEMDLVGPTCAPSLAEHGPLWPPLLHSWPPTFALAGGGSILTGEGGDELFDVRRATSLRYLAAHPRRVSRPLLKEVAIQGGPAMVRRRRAIADRRSIRPPWLRPEAGERWLDELVAWDLGEPYGWARAVRRAVSDRSHQMGLHNFAVLASMHGATLHHPLLDPVFVAAVTSAGGPLGFAGRTSAMRRLFGDVLPDALLARADKVHFDPVVFSAATRAFAQEWSGRGVDGALVDPEALRAALGGDPVVGTAALALQAAWCADHRQA